MKISQNFAAFSEYMNFKEGKIGTTFLSVLQTHDKSCVTFCDMITDESNLTRLIIHAVRIITNHYLVTLHSVLTKYMYKAFSSYVFNKQVNTNVIKFE